MLTHFLCNAVLSHFANTHLADIQIEVATFCNSTHADVSIRHACPVEVNKVFNEKRKAEVHRLCYTASRGIKNWYTSL